MIDGQIIEEAEDEEEDASDSDDMDGIGDVESEEEDKSKIKKKKFKTFRTKEIPNKTIEPNWDYQGCHFLDIDEDVILKL